ncbi:hypothetical protein F6R98_03600 [Candidatus Methylospira mobilis]|uniref:Uncharacterized protein n=1 Tax=Candidatus Methylospira mobilis TaxID=1808979 RepID=A0A5Q0BJ28_9GAMM|nr:hypothetical protein [Candidatus Methylospira mobilis]QFY41826.1 hypothetical protein F6R98_03600 [Candidatus Methylospira mobilis]WNV06693.1 hypothetical protein RP726_09885 [Candidatus Methylospira mobilis]
MNQHKFIHDIPNTRKPRDGKPGFALIVIVGLITAGLVYLKTQRDYQQALQNYRNLSKIERFK